jgi:toxin ParE1/3/4
VPAVVTFHPDAASELQGAYDWYLRRSEPSALALALEIDIAIERIAASPTRWPKLAGEIHRYLLKRFPFSLIYRIKHGEIQIVAVAHARRRPGYWQLR